MQAFDINLLQTTHRNGVEQSGFWNGGWSAGWEQSGVSSQGTPWTQRSPSGGPIEPSARSAAMVGQSIGIKRQDLSICLTLRISRLVIRCGVEACRRERPSNGAAREKHKGAGGSNRAPSQECMTTHTFFSPPCRIVKRCLGEVSRREFAGRGREHAVTCQRKSSGP